MKEEILSLVTNVHLDLEGIMKEMSNGKRQTSYDFTHACNVK